MIRLRATVLAALLVVSLGATAVAAPVAATHEGESCSFPSTATDGTGTDVTLNEPAERVVVADAASAQTFWEVGAADRVVGMPVRPYTEYLNGSGSRTDVLSEDGTGFDTETIVELDADLVVAPNYMTENTVTQLRQANQTVYRSPFEESFEDIYAKTELYGHFVGECEAATETADDTRAEVESIRESAADRDRPRVLYYFFGTAAGGATFIGDMVGTAGGTNVAAEAGIDDFAEISDEVVLERDPQWIVTTDEAGAFDPEAEPFASTTAVRNDRILEVDANLVSQAAPRVVEPLAAMAEAFAETEPASNGTETTVDEATEDDGAGFGGAVAVGALLAAAFLVTRRS